MQDSNNLFLFNEEQIEMIFSLGYQDAESLQFLQNITQTKGDDPNA